MVDRGVLLAQLALKIARSPAGDPLTDRLCRACHELLEVDGVALTLGYTRDSRVTLCTTDDVSARLEDLQEVLAEGPGHDASTSGQLVSGPLPSPGREPWPLLSEAVHAQLSPLHVLALPLSFGADPMGVLTLHRRGPFTAEEKEGAQFLADAIGAAILRDADARSESPSEPWLSRSTVHMATGMVVAQLGVTPEDALALVRAYAFAREVSINDIAEQIVERRLRLDESS